MPLLRAVRRAFGFRLEEVAAHCGLPPARLREIEATDDPEVEESVALQDALGIDLDRLFERGRLDRLDLPLAALLKARNELLDADTRFTFTAAIAVARDVRELEAQLGEPEAWAAVAAFRDSGDYSHPRAGAHAALARLVRDRLGLGDEPIRSMNDDVLGPLRVLLLGAEFDPAVDAFSFAAPATGAVVVLNRRGRHGRNAFLRRVSVAHELCHVLFDRARMRDVTEFCRLSAEERPHPRRREEFERVERRARAFAPELLAPLGRLRREWRSARAGEGLEGRVRRMIVHFGVGYEAMRAQLDNAGLLDLRTAIPFVDPEATPEWEAADPLPGADRRGALARVPMLRRGVFLDLVLRAWREGIVGESAARELLRVGRADWGEVRPVLVERMGADPGAGWRPASARG